MTALGQALIVVSVLASGTIYGTDVFPAIVLRPALVLVGDRAVVPTMGRVHESRGPEAPPTSRVTVATLTPLSVSTWRPSGRQRCSCTQAYC